MLSESKRESENFFDVCGIFFDLDCSLVFFAFAALSLIVNRPLNFFILTTKFAYFLPFTCR